MILRKLFLLTLAFLLSTISFSGCGGSDIEEGEPPSYSDQMIYLLTTLKNSTVRYNELEKSDVKPYLEKAIISIDEAAGMMQSYKADEDIPYEFLNEISAVVSRAVSSVNEAALRSKVKDNRYELLEKALKFVADRLLII
jgi:hypothetical protein